MLLDTMMRCVYSLSFLMMLMISHNNNNSCYAFIPSSTTTTTTTTSIIRSRKQQSVVLYSKESLATEGDWNAYLDDATTGLIYYFNTKSGESKWVKPTDTFPSIKLDSKQQSIADTIQKEYRKNKAAAEEEAKSGEEEEEEANKESSSLFGSFFASDEKKDEPKEEQQQQQQPSSDIKKSNNLFFASQDKEEEKVDDSSIIEDESDEEEEQQSEKKGFNFGGLFSMFGKKDEASASAGQVVADSGGRPSIGIDMSAYVLPHPAKVRWGGEDAIFCVGRTFGVFDGVSGAEKLDGIPLYSVTLAQEMKAMIGQEAISIDEITKQLTDAAEFADRSATGASTAVVGSLGDNGILNVLNVGDSSCMVVRNDKVVTKTDDIVHYFDCPYQLSEDSPDRPRDGTRMAIRVQKGDTILMGSDGVFDNLDDTALCKIVTEQGPQTRAAVLARKVVEASRRVSLDPKANTPYAKEARRAGESDYSDGVGGKLDDVSCVVVRCS